MMTEAPQPSCAFSSGPGAIGGSCPSPADRLRLLELLFHLAERHLLALEPLPVLEQVVGSGDQKHDRNPPQPTVRATANRSAAVCRGCRWKRGPRADGVAATTAPP